MRGGRTRLLALIALAAVALRLVLFLGRGDYLAFDEGWYLLLARSLYTGDGYSLIGIPHVTLSPLFPILAGAMGVVLDSWVWGGRVVAALASGLLVLPAWAVFRRLASGRVALMATALVAVMPSLAPFVAAFWIGADLWVGAEPVLHLFLWAGVATWLWADEGSRPWRWAVPGAFFALAFLARPEAIITWGLLGLATLGIALRTRSGRRLAGAAVMGVAFLAVASPYWVHLHDVTGRWALTGRGVGSAGAAVQTLTGGDRAGPAGTIEQMLWENDAAYARRLYSLHPSGLRMRSDYWGVYPDPGPEQESAGPAAGAPVTDTPVTPGVSPPEPEAAAPAPTPGASGAAPPDRPSPWMLYLRTLGNVVPLLLWPFVFLGLSQARSRSVLRRELPVTLSLVGTSVAIAAVVAVDARTQLFLVPLLAFYAARGFSMLEHEVEQRAGGAELRKGFVGALLAVVAVVWMLGIHGRRLYLSVAIGSPHHLVGEHNRAVAEELDFLTGDGGGPIMSWHPALGVFADRDWRPLPHAALPRILRYADAAGAEVIVLSVYYPPDLNVETLNTRYLVLDVPEAAAEAAAETAAWTVRIERGDSIRAVGRLEPGT